MVTATASPTDEVLARLRGVKARGSAQWMAYCPVHEGAGEHDPSLSVRRAHDGSVLLNCFAGCETPRVVEALGLSMADLFAEAPAPRANGAPRGGNVSRMVATYDYTDESGALLYQSVRYEPKRFSQRRPDGAGGWVWNLDGTRRVLFHLPQLARAIASGETVYLAEGEKDVLACEAAGLAATCNPMGAGKWLPEYVEQLRGAVRITIIQDKDAPGQQHARLVAHSLEAAGIDWRIVEAAEGKDAADHFAAGYGVADFLPVEVSTTVDSPDLRLSPVGDASSTRRLKLTPASAITPRRVTWFWDTAPLDTHPSEAQGRFPDGSFVVAGGHAGLGKSLFAAWMAAQITRGTLPGSGYGRPRGVLYAATEDSWAMTIVPRLMAAGADLTRVYRLDVESDGDGARLTLPVDTALLPEVFAEFDIALMVLDPFLSVLDGSVDDYRAKEVRAATEPLIAVLDECKVTCLALAHFTKATVSDPLLLIAGSGAFGQLPRAAIGFAGNAADGYVLSQAKNNLGRMNLPNLSYSIEAACVETPEGESWTSRFVFTGESMRSVSDILRDAADPTTATDDRRELDRWLADFLSDGPVRAKDALEAGKRLGYSEQQVKRARDRIGAKSNRHGAIRDAYYVWALPGAAPAPPTEDEFESLMATDPAYVGAPADEDRNAIEYRLTPDPDETEEWA